MANFSMFDHTGELPDSLPFDCDSSYDTYSEMLIYLGMFLYLSVGLISHGYILMCVLVTKRKMFLESSFFRLFAVDSIASIIVILNELLFIHLFLFVPPLCSKIGPYFWTYSYTPKFVYLSLNHSRFMKSLAQVFMVVNRMTCVVVTKPGRYDQMWKKWTPISCFLITVLPFAGTWNIFISRVFAVSQRGGFSLGYEKVVKWASISLFQSISIFIALFFTIICTSITLYNLILLPGRIKSAERSLCFSSIFISITFLLAAGTQMLFHVCPSCDIDSLYIFQFLAFDTFTVGSAVIMILVNKNLRGPIFQGMKRVSIVSSSS